LCELIEMLDAATLAPVKKIAQTLGVRLDGLGVSQHRFRSVHSRTTDSVYITLDIRLFSDRASTSGDLHQLRHQFFVTEYLPATRL
jgi:hypothetical protein